MWWLPAAEDGQYASNQTIRDIQVLTTFHEGKMEDAGKKHFRTDKNIMKLDVVIHYKKNMQLLDKLDMMIGSLECVHHCIKWYKSFVSFVGHLHIQCL